MKLLNLPNTITLIRASFIPIIIAGICGNEPWMLASATALFLLASVLDYLDGYFARRYGQITAIGTFFDPIVDKIMMLSLFFIFVDLGLIPLWMALLLLVRELLISGLRELGSLKGRVVGADWTGRMKFRSQVVLVTFILLFLFGESCGYTINYGREIIYYGTLFNVILALMFLHIFYWRNRRFFVGKEDK